MATDNTVINRGVGGDTIRDIARQGGTAKTQVVQWDIGGAAANAEVLMTAGQQLMAVSVPVVLASDHTALPVASKAAVNYFGQSIGLTAGATDTLASIASSAPGYQIKGLVANGIGEGYFTIQVAMMTVLSGRIRSSMPTLAIILSNGVAVETGSLVTLNVTNESGSTADFEATLLGA